MPYNPNVAAHEIIPTGIKLSRFYHTLVHGQHEPEYKPPRRANPVAVTLIAGASDPGSSLHALFGHGDVLELIFVATREAWVKALLDVVDVGEATGTVAFDHVDNVTFPKPSGININMMPFVMGQKETLPAAYHAYWPMIEQATSSARQKGAIGYLTIHEGHTKPGHSQRRPGLHTEGFMKAPASSQASRKSRRSSWHPWGMGIAFKHRFEGDPRTAAAMCPGLYDGGIFMASSVDRSCRVWDASLREAGLVGELGNIEHLRHTLSSVTTSHEMLANELFWMTDATPHESVPLADETFRQYFRLVTRQIGVWYKAHSTPNPLNIVPPPSVQIVTHDKFTGKEPEPHAPRPSESDDQVRVDGDAADQASGADPASRSAENAQGRELLPSEATEPKSGLVDVLITKKAPMNPMSRLIGWLRGRVAP